jgi:hypothetical protein
MAHEVVQEKSVSKLAYSGINLIAKLEECGIDPHLLISRLHQATKPQLIGLIEGTHEIKEVVFFVDLDQPFDVKEGFTLFSGRKEKGRLRIGASKLKLFPCATDEGKKCGLLVRRKLLKKYETLGFIVCENLLEQPKYIPEIWKGRINGKSKIILFADDVFHNRSEFLCLGIWWDGKKWHKETYSLKEELGEEFFIAVLFNHKF